MKGISFWFLGLACLALVSTRAFANDDDEEICDKDKNCKSPNCLCATWQNPTKFSSKSIPHFVMLTFDDAINVVNIEFYRDLLNSRTRTNTNPNKCRIGATFFVSHEYNDYHLVNELYKNGSEIAVHTISHLSDTEHWRYANLSTWTAEAKGMRAIISRFSLVPEKEIVGFRAPFLQTSGNVTFDMLVNEGFLYDSSLPNQLDSKPFWPFTYDFGLPHACMIEPCPTKHQKGLWEVPMNSMFKERLISPDKWKRMPCAMADGCLPYPLTEEETYTYLMTNFERFTAERTPFPLFLHEAWLKVKGRRDGYLKFINTIKQRPEVYITSIREVIEYLKNPTTLVSYKQRRCIENVDVIKPCAEEAQFCTYAFPDMGSRVMYICEEPCPRRYPNVKNPMGL